MTDTIHVGDRVSLHISEEPDPVSGTVLRLYGTEVAGPVADVELGNGEVRPQCVRFLTRIGREISRKDADADPVDGVDTGPVAEWPTFGPCEFCDCASCTGCELNDGTPDGSFCGCDDVKNHKPGFGPSPSRYSRNGAFGG